VLSWPLCTRMKRSVGARPHLRCDAHLCLQQGPKKFQLSVRPSLLNDGRFEREEVQPGAVRATLPIYQQHPPLTSSPPHLTSSTSVADACRRACTDRCIARRITDM
jgi:hypothetical protein